MSWLVRRRMAGRRVGRAALAMAGA
jgi:hypothetical protein